MEKFLFWHYINLFGKSDISKAVSNSFLLIYPQVAMTGMLILAVLILGGVGLVAAQIPTACANNNDLLNGTCCPDDCGGSTRGECVHVSTMCNISYSKTGLPIDAPTNFANDGRFNWPSQIFNYTCQCKGNYGGYDCLDCKFGYGPRGVCNKTARVRRSITEDNFDWENYRYQLNMSKTEIQTRYKVYTGGSLTDESNYKNVTLYNLFAWMHHYVAWTAKEKYYQSESGKS